MLLAIDIENRTTNFGLFENDKMLANFTLASSKDRSASELYLVIKYLLLDKKIDMDKIDDVIISSVVPELDKTYATIGEYIIGKSPTFISAGLKIGINIKCDNPKDVGSDRIIRAVGARDRFKDDLIIISASTITTIDYINSKKEFVGGLIMPGINLFQESLFKESAKLPQVEIIKSDKILGKTTTSAMQNGIYFAYKSAIISIIDRIIDQHKLDIKNTKIIISGEYNSLIQNEKYKLETISNLGLYGLNKIYKLNMKK